MAVRRGELAPPEHGEHGANRACNSLVAIQKKCGYVFVYVYKYTCKVEKLDKINKVQKFEEKDQEWIIANVIFIKH